MSDDTTISTASAVEAVAVLILRGVDNAEIARRIGVSQSTSLRLARKARSDIMRRSDGRKRSGGGGKIPEIQVQEIRDRLAAGEAMRTIAESRNVSMQAISALIRRHNQYAKTAPQGAKEKRWTS